MTLSSVPLLMMSIAGLIVIMYISYSCRNRKRNNSTTEYFLNILDTINKNMNCNGNTKTDVSASWSDTTARTMMCTYRPDVCENRKPGTIFSASDVKDVVSILEPDAVSCPGNSCVSSDSKSTMDRQEVNACQFVINDNLLRVTRECSHFAISGVKVVKTGLYKVDFLKTANMLKSILVPRCNLIKTSVATYEVTLEYVSVPNLGDVFVCLSKRYDSGLLFNNNSPPSWISASFGSSTVPLIMDQDGRADMVDSDVGIHTEFAWNESRQLSNFVTLKMSCYTISQTMSYWSDQIPNNVAPIGNTLLAKVPFLPYGITIMSSFSLKKTSTSAQIMSDTPFFSVQYSDSKNKSVRIFSAKFVGSDSGSKTYNVTDNFQVVLLEFEVGGKFPVYVRYGDSNSMHIIVTNTYVHVIITDSARETSVYSLKNCGIDYLLTSKSIGDMTINLSSVGFAEFREFRTCYGVANP